jgi:hypothetical protein
VLGISDVPITCSNHVVGVDLEIVPGVGNLLFVVEEKCVPQAIDKLNRFGLSRWGFFLGKVVAGAG